MDKKQTCLDSPGWEVKAFDMMSSLVNHFCDAAFFGSPSKKGDEKSLTTKKGTPKRFGIPHKLINFPTKERRSIYGKIMNRADRLFN